MAKSAGAAAAVFTDINKGLLAAVYGALAFFLLLALILISLAALHYILYRFFHIRKEIYREEGITMAQRRMSNTAAAANFQNSVSASGMRNRRYNNKKITVLPFI